nr:FAD-binding domain-containing protein [Actibacterium ureilyticum]
MSFIQEVFWRGYFKGWLEQHPTVWASYRHGLAQHQSDLSADYADAIHARTGIACFDHWCNELRDTGYLHNHARMWFASIWIFTLRLPWELGAAFFLDNLSDGDPASNTLSWRWVAGLHTSGKPYLATAENIARFTGGRFFPQGQLNEAAAPLTERVAHDRTPLRPRSVVAGQGMLRLVTEEDCLHGLPGCKDHAGMLGIVSPQASGFAQAAVRATCDALGGDTHVGHGWGRAIAQAAHRAGTRDVVTAHVPTGFVADGLHQARATLRAQGITLHQVLRPYDALVWPHADRGFFKLKKQIPALLAALPG